MPVLAGHEDIRVVALVDRDLGRARELARAYGVATAVADLSEVPPDTFDGVVLATPPRHHAQAARDLLNRGLHVFVEKPMATSLDVAVSMVDAARQNGRVLAVGHFRRMLPVVSLAADLIQRGSYGRVMSVDAEEGGPYGWNLATLDVLTRDAGGGGVLIDLGSHVIDEIGAIVPGRFSLQGYEDNARGGVETDCVALFDIQGASHTVPVRLELSRTRELGGRIRITCEDAVLEIARADFTRLAIHPTRDGSAADINVRAEWTGQTEYVGYQAFRDEIDDWIRAIRTGRTADLDGATVLPTVALIDECYRRRVPMAEPWTDEGLSPLAVLPVVHPAKRVLVTGAGGFVGARTVELLSERLGYDVTALVKSPRSAARLAARPARIVLGDVCSATDMERALEHCDGVVHCAVGTSWIPEEVRRVTVDGTRIVAEAALKRGVSRLVHISSMFVHARGVADTLDEATPLTPPANDGYAQNKLAAERALAVVARRGLSTITLRPTRIYGPHSKTFTVRPLAALLEKRLAISGDPGVPANMVYVDNVVQAIAQALAAPAALSGASFLVSDSDQLSLRDFYEYFARASGAVLHLTGTTSTARPSRRGLVRRWYDGLVTIAKAPEVRALVHRIMDTDPVGAVPKALWNASPALQARLLHAFGVDQAVTFRSHSRAPLSDLLTYHGDRDRVLVTKAERELGYSPMVPLDRALELTLAWAAHARLVRGPVASATAELAAC